MKFEISRTSTKPCDEAIKESNKWIVNIESLESLIEFRKKYGRLILEEAMYNENTVIEIYDDYRE